MSNRDEKRPARTGLKIVAGSQVPAAERAGAQARGTQAPRAAMPGRRRNGDHAAGATDGRRRVSGRLTEEEKPIRVVLIESNPDHRTTLRTAVGELKGLIIAGEADRVEPGLREVLKARPEVVIVGLDQPEQALELTEKLTAHYPETVIVISGDSSSAELVKRAMRAGVREYLARPPEPQEIQAALRRLLRQRAHATSSPRLAGEIISVFAAKGGLGATFLATNLAVLLAETGERQAAIVDLNLELGDVVTFLNMKAEHSILDLVEQNGGLDSQLLESTLATHRTGLRLLAQPEDTADADRIRAGEVGEVLTRLKTMFEYVVIDTARRFDERTLEALDLSDQILLLAALDLPTIRNTRRCIEVFNRLGYGERLKLVVNRHRPHRAAERLERSFGAPIYWHLPDDYATAISSINAGVPATEVGPETELAKSLRTLAATLSGHDEENATGTRERTPRGLLRRLLSS
jgi:pilus assembly protein CpaE